MVCIIQFTIWVMAFASQQTSYKSLSLSVAQKRQYCSNCAKLLGHGAAICLPSVKWLRCTALAGDIVLWKLFRQTFYCHPEYGGGSWQSQHQGWEHILCDDNIMTSGHHWGLTSASGPQWQECNARAQPRASTRNDNDSLPALQRYTLHVTMHPSPTQPAPCVHYTPHNPTQPWPWQWHWSRDMSHMCSVRGNGLPSLTGNR